MPVKNKKTKKYFEFTVRKRHFHVLLDKVLLFRYSRRLHGRFWGITGVMVLIGGMFVCFLIRPDLLGVSTALSMFGNDVRTAPYFAGSMFFAAYGLWRWRNYLRRTLKRPHPLLDLINLTIIGLYLVALMPVGWKPLSYHIHIIGMTLAGCSMAAAVIIDGVLSKSRQTMRGRKWRLIRALSFVLILSGGWFTLGSTDSLHWYNVAFLGEAMMLTGYTLWVCVKTYQGEGNRSALSRMLKNVVLID